jgi:serine/threonine-protein kinase
VTDTPSNPPGDRAPPPDGEETVRRERDRDTLASAGASESRRGRFEAGQPLGSRYRIVSLLGKGGMGEVYRADDLELGQSVALKFLPERVATDPSWVRRFRNEVRTAREVAHPNVCRIYDIGEEDGHVFLSMEYVDGEDLAGVLRRLGRPSREKAIEIARQICLGLAAAHENGVLHRDLKPANIMIDGRGHVRITDFGLAGFLDELEQVEARAGTPAYMAPEQLTNGKVSVRSDVYTLGLILHELFTGKCVFETNDVEELKRQHSSGSVSTPSSIGEAIDPAVQRVIMRCLEEEPERRPQSVYQVLAALPGGDPLAAALAAGETPSPEMIASARGRGGLRPAVALTLLALCVAAVLLSALMTDGMVTMPVKGPDALDVEAALALRRLGHTDLPANSAAGYEMIRDWSGSGADTEATGSSGEGAGTYGYWRRWASGSLLPSKFHNPYAVGRQDPPMSRPGDALVLLDARGRLREATVIPDRAAEPLDETDWSAVFDLLGVDESSATSTEPVRSPERTVDELRAWTVDRAPGVVIQAGAVGGRIVSFDLVAPPDEGSPEGRPRDVTSIVRSAESVLEALVIAAQLAMIFLAVRNIRLRRSDTRAALRIALLMVGLEMAIEILAIRVHERSLLEHVGGLLSGQAAGHVALHGVKMFIAYVAIEPYVRRLWPRLLVGTMRLVSGRVADPQVGREMLIGCLVGLLLPIMAGIIIHLALEIPEGVLDRLSPIKLGILSDVSVQVIINLVALAWGMVFTVSFAVLLVFARIVLRRNGAALAFASIFVVLQFFAFVQFLAQVGTSGLVVAFVIAVLAGAVIAVTSVRSGLLSVYFTFVMFLSSSGLTFSLRLGEWYSVNTVMSAAFVLTFPVIGCWLSLAGQPIFRDVLAEPAG